LPLSTASDTFARALLGVLACALVLAAPAAADTYCVAPATGCDHAVASLPSQQDTIQSALNAAAAHAGDDTVQLGAATYEIDDDTTTITDLTYSFSGSGQATLKGMGPGQTILNRNVLPQPPAAISGGVLNVTDLTLDVPGSGSALEADSAAIATKGPLFQNLVIDVPTSSNVGILLDEPLNETVRNVTFNGPAARADSSTCVEVNPGAPGSTQTISDVTATNCEIDLAHPHAGATIERAKINGQLGVMGGDGDPQLIENSVIHAQLAIETVAGAALVVRQSTLVGDGAGMGLLVNNFSTADTATVHISDTIVHGFATAFHLTNSPHAAPDSLTTDYVAYATPISQDAGTTFTHTHDLGDPDPQFTGPGDYALEPTSPLIDQDPTALSLAEASTDLGGNARLVDGKRDVGAYERPDPTATTDPATAVTQTAATLSGTADEGGAAGGGSAQLVYGTTAVYGQSVATQALALSADAVTITGALSGLEPATTYHYALNVGTPLGTVTSADRTFTTPAVVAGGGGSGPPGGGGNPRTAAAVIRALSFSPSSFRAAKSGATLAAATRKPKGGATLSIGLDIAATVTFAVTRQDRGVKSGKRCLARGHGRHGRACTRAVKVGTASSRALNAGTTRLRFSGRVSGKPLKVAKYVLTATPRGGWPRTAKFSIKR
jgi:hypothetical protein